MEQVHMLACFYSYPECRSPLGLMIFTLTSLLYPEDVRWSGTLDNTSDINIVCNMLSDDQMLLNITYWTFTLDFDRAVPKKMKLQRTLMGCDLR